MFLRFIAEAFSPRKATCTTCGATGECRIHGYYDRNIIDFIHGEVVKTSTRVTRLMCLSCHHTHAVLTDVLIPYSRYSIFFVLRVLGEYFCRKTSVEKICGTYQISPNTLYRWVKIWNKHKSQWLGTLKDEETPSLDFLKNLIKDIDYSVFSCSFTEKTAYTFLQIHRNPKSNSPKYYRPKGPPACS